MHLTLVNANGYITTNKTARTALNVPLCTCWHLSPGIEPPRCVLLHALKQIPLLPLVAVNHLFSFLIRKLERLLPAQFLRVNIPAVPIAGARSQGCIPYQYRGWLGGFDKVARGRGNWLEPQPAVGGSNCAAVDGGWDVHVFTMLIVV